MGSERSPEVHGDNGYTERELEAFKAKAELEEAKKRVGELERASKPTPPPLFAEVSELLITTWWQNGSLTVNRGGEVWELQVISPGLQEILRAGRHLGNLQMDCIRFLDEFGARLASWYRDQGHRVSVLSLT